MIELGSDAYLYRMSFSDSGSTVRGSVQRAARKVGIFAPCAKMSVGT